MQLCAHTLTHICMQTNAKVKDRNYLSILADFKLGVKTGAHDQQIMAASMCTVATCIYM